jgi:hypothetical protein
MGGAFGTGMMGDEQPQEQVMTGGGGGGDSPTPSDDSFVELDDL